jgi:hypothetical protein
LAVGSGRWRFLDQHKAQDAATTIDHIPTNAHTLLDRCHFQYEYPFSTVIERQAMRIRAI